MIDNYIDALTKKAKTFVAERGDVPEQALLDNMVSISRDYYNSRWIKNLEFALWDMIVEPDKSYVSPLDLLNLAILAKTLNGWWTMPFTTPTFIPLDEWETKYDRHVTRL